MSEAIRILVIDDSEDDRELYRRELSKRADAHYDIVEAQDGERALIQIEETAPDCILLDYSLPGHNGIAVLKRIHARHPHLPVVSLAGDRNDSFHFYRRLDRWAEEIPKGACDVAAVLEEAKESLGEVSRERKPVIVCDPLPFVEANRMQLLQVLQNLLCNAIYHCGADPRIRIEVTDEADYWAFRFCDNGSGIGEAEHKRIFEPFTRLDGHNSQGLGLGLAICKKIVESHGGSIRCESERGSGAAFIFTLPKADAKAVEAASARSDSGTATTLSTEAAETRLANVLLVDDNKADLKLVQIMLGEVSRLRCNFLIAHDANEALKV